MRESEDMPMRDNIDELIDGLIAREDGFVDHPADKGGPTRWRITQSAARRHGYMGQMENLPHNVAALI
jgi:lysozyme family protein